MELLGNKFLGPVKLDSPDISNKSGVYIFVSSKDENFNPLYIGHATNIKSRMRDHQRIDNLRKDSVANKIIDGTIDSIYYCHFGEKDRNLSLELERKLTIKYLPKYNRHLFTQAFNNETIIEMKEREFASAKRATSLTMGAFILGLVSLFMSLYFANNDFTSKEKIQKSIITAITNEADLRAIKQIYLNREKTSRGVTQIFKAEENLYSYGVPLSMVLEDIRTNMYLTKTNIGLLDKVDSLIELHTHINPFDKLEPAQRDYFENIKIKLKADYSDVIPEVNKIANELHNKNSLVDEYLKDSKTSFWVSVFALLFSIVVSGYQLFNGRASRIQRMIAEGMSKVVVGDDDKST